MALVGTEYLCSQWVTHVKCQSYLGAPDGYLTMSVVGDRTWPGGYQRALKMWSYKPINYCYNESQSIEDLPKIDFALFWLNLYRVETLLQIEQFTNNIASCTQKYRVHVCISFLTIVVVVLNVDCQSSISFLYTKMCYIAILLINSFQWSDRLTKNKWF